VIAEAGIRETKGVTRLDASLTGPSQNGSTPGVNGVVLAAAHQGSCLPSRKNPPVGPSSPSRTAHRTRAAPISSGWPPGPPMSVAIHPGQTAFTRIPVPMSSAASTRVSAFNAAGGRPVAVCLLETGREQDVVHRDHADSRMPRQIAESGPLGASGDN
jgi:hypothetical protein